MVTAQQASQYQLRNHMEMSNYVARKAVLPHMININGAVPALLALINGGLGHPCEATRRQNRKLKVHRGGIRHSKETGFANV